MDSLLALSTNPEVLSLLRFDGAKESLAIWVLDHDRPRRATPEETMRQIFVAALVAIYKYPRECIACEVTLQVGINRPRADIVVYNDQRAVEAVIEVKAYNPSHARDQLESYLKVTGARFGAVVLRDSISCFEVSTDSKMCLLNSFPSFQSGMTPRSYTDVVKQNTPKAPFYPIEALERLSKGEIVLRYKGESIRMANGDAASLIKVKRAFLGRGVAFNCGKISGADWFDRISLAISEAKTPESNDCRERLCTELLETLSWASIPGSPDLLLHEAIATLSDSKNASGMEHLKKRLETSGIRVEGKTIIFANSILSLLLRNTRYSDNWRSIVNEIPGATKKGTTRFAGRTSRGVAIPLEVFIKNTEGHLEKSQPPLHLSEYRVDLADQT
jgi:hypothetical protein